MLLMGSIPAPLVDKPLRKFPEPFVDALRANMTERADTKEFHKKIGGAESLKFEFMSLKSRHGH